MAQPRRAVADDRERADPAGPRDDVAERPGHPTRERSRQHEAQSGERRGDDAEPKDPAPRVGARPGDQEFHVDDHEEGQPKGERVADKVREAERARLEVEELRHAETRVVVPQGEVPGTDESPVERVPGHHLAHGVTVGVVVNDAVQARTERGEGGVEVETPEAAPVLQCRRQKERSDTDEGRHAGEVGAAANNPLPEWPVGAPRHRTARVTAPRPLERFRRRGRTAIARGTTWRDVVVFGPHRLARSRLPFGPTSQLASGRRACAQEDEIHGNHPHCVRRVGRLPRRLHRTRSPYSGPTSPTSS